MQADGGRDAIVAAFLFPGGRDALVPGVKDRPLFAPHKMGIIYIM